MKKQTQTQDTPIDGSLAVINRFQYYLTMKDKEKKSACGNCINFCKVSKRSGRCDFHTIWMFDRKLNQDVIKKMTVYKYNYCDNWKQKLVNIKKSVEINIGRNMSAEILLAANYPLGVKPH